MHIPISDLLPSTLKLVSSWGRVFFPQGGCTESYSQSDNTGHAFVLSTRGHLFILTILAQALPFVMIQLSFYWKSTYKVDFLQDRQGMSCPSVPQILCKRAKPT